RGARGVDRTARQGAPAGLPNAARWLFGFREAMRHLAGVLALAGLALAVVLFARSDVDALAALLVGAGPGLLLASLFHVVPMIVNAHAWQRLLPVLQRPSLRTMTRATWIRESVNGLLPVARIGGEIVAYRIVRRHVALRSDAAASLMAD